MESVHDKIHMQSRCITPKMKGLENVKAFLRSGSEDTLSTAKDILPSSEVDRDALIQALLEVRVELATLKASNRIKTSASTSVVTGGSEPKASTPSASPELDAATPPFVPTAQNAKEPEQPREEKPESERLCVSMWGVKECPGTSVNECVRKHLPLCHSPLCFGRPDRRKTCTEENSKWHGHMNAQYRAAVRAEKKRKREENEKREFAEYKKMKHKGNLKTPSAPGGTHKHPKSQKESKPHKEAAASRETKKKTHNHAQSHGKWSQPRPGPRTIGDFFPNLPRPAQQGSVWGNPPPNTAWAPTPAAPTNAQELLLSLKALLNSGVV